MPTLSHRPAQTLRSVVLPVAIVVLIAMAVGAVQDEPADEPPGPGEPQQLDEREAPPSLDELLGLEDAEQDQSAIEAARRDRDEELQRELAEAAIADTFALALEKMAITADLLDVRLDPGLGTQRLQEEILVKLDQLVDQARELQSLGGASSASGRSSQNRTPPKPQPRPNTADSRKRRDAQSQDSQAGDPPPRRDGDINTVLEETRTEWGHLPQRIRDMLLQGRNEKFSSLYEQLTREYYKRLAEEGSS